MSTSAIFPRAWRPIGRLLAVATTAVAVTACSTSDVTAPPAPSAGAFTVDATTQWVYVSLADSAVVTPTPSSGQSSAWDIAFNATNVMLNGGQAGPGGVMGFCVCQNASRNPTNAEWLAMTPAGEKADFDSLTRTPSGATFVTDQLTPAIGGFYRGSGTTATANPDSVYFVRYADSTGFAKVRVTALTTPSATTPGQVTIEYALAGNADAAFGTTRTAQIDVSTGAKNFDLNSGQVSTSATDWELRFDGYTVRVNGGASGPSKSAAAKITDATFAAATPASTVANAYRADVYAGIFNTARYYRYNLAGDNRISPSFDVYLIRRGTRTYKLQIINYYNSTGSSRYITFRYAQLAE
ncbi:MAG TPA: hypothetical protein DGD08_13820 [Gemmatimonas aurantiaca]|uniref:HmuY protein n=2 Tax=Gemmatimonas aurantiaca TaxID=173480 RepID=C1AAB6_GEMAT|nr:HmuY family protein [Gemmatimonas aurantiaca]BAH39714.1 hypothetical protein GAU_2672 [Gemmatimonas aurantiaca T-27]HCT58276.1 hypothetical protein [Gemmatimonas aurantiaca]